MARKYRVASSVFNKTNKKQILPLMLAGIILTGCGTSKTDQEYLQSAKVYSEQGNYSAASIELKNALQQNPQNAEARILLARLYLRIQQGAAAEKEIEKAINYGADKNLLVEDVARALYYQYRFKDLIDKTLQIESLTPAQKSHLFLLRGLAQIMLQKPNDALTEFKMASLEAPNEANSQLSLAYVNALEKKYDEALELLNGIIGHQSDNPEAYILRSRIFTDKKQTEKAIDDLQHAINIEPNRMELYLFITRLELSIDQFEAAEKNIDIILKRAPNHVTSNLLKAGIRLQAKDYEGALKSAETALNREETDKRAKLMVGMSQFYLENFESARKQLLSVVDTLPPTHVAHRMLAYSNFRLGYSDDALKSFSDSGNSSKHDIALMNEFGSKMAQQGNLAEAQAWFEKASKANPDDVNAQTRLGIVKLMQNEESGADALEKLLDKQENAPAARMALIEYHISKGNKDEAKKLAQDAINKQPEKADGYVLQGIVHNFTGEFDKAIGYFKTALGKDSNNHAAYMNLVKAYVAKNDIASALAQLRKILELNPAHETALIQYFALSKKAGSTDEAYTRIVNAVNTNKDQQSLKIIQAGALLELNNTSEAIAILTSIPQSERSYVTAQELLGKIYIKTGQYELALTHVKNWREKTPSSPAPHQAVISVMAKMGDLKGALEENQKALKLIPNEQSLLSSEVKLLFVNKMTEQGKKRIARLRNEGVDLPEFEIYQAEYAMSEKDYANAELHYSNYHKKVNTTKSLLTLASTLYKIEKSAQADKLLADWLAKYPDDQAVKLYKANRNISTDHSAAIAQYRQILSKSPKNIVALNNLAWVLGESGQLEEAAQVAESAFQLMPNSAPILDTYGYILFQNGQQELAVTHLEAAHKGAPSDPTIGYHYALALSQLKKNEEAKAVLLKFVNRTYPEQDEAKKLLKTL